MPERGPFTFREAILTSLLLHACLIIYVLLFPDTFRPAERASVGRVDPNGPIPMEFVMEPEPAPEPPRLALGDAGRRTSSDDRPENAPPPENEDPFSIGNTLNRFVAAPQPVPAPASPEPGPSADARRASAPRGGAGPEGEGGDEVPGEPGGAGAAPTHSVGAEGPPAGDGAGAGAGSGGRREGAGGRAQRSIRDALGQMSVGMSGGSSLKYDNPVGGLTGPLGGLSFDTAGFDWGPYSRKIYWIIWTNWTQGWPPAAWAGLKGVVTVRFRIWKDGRITDIRILEGSGTVAFDTCATIALEASSPLPPLPDDFPKESEGITARFLYNLSGREK
ncbi:MAG TPA: TonB family protein [Candidatus Polarisedimenticolia bacterium]|nr:TonB family protein [Candidatus Polarisedimenticolia bacterium]